MDPGLIGGIIGTVGGLLGGVIGTYCSIKSTKTQAERRFTIKFCIGGWVAGILIVGLPLVLMLTGIIPVWLWQVMLAFWFVLLTLAILWANKRSQAILRE